MKTSTTLNMIAPVWFGLVGKGEEGGEPVIPLQDMLHHIAATKVNGRGFDAIDQILIPPYGDGGWSTDEILRHAEMVTKIVPGGFADLVAFVWSGSAMTTEGQKQFLTEVRKACAYAKALNGNGFRKPGHFIRVDSAEKDLLKWASDRSGNTAKIAETMRLAVEIAHGEGEELAAEGEPCWAAMDTFPRMMHMLDQAPGLHYMFDMAHTALFMLGDENGEDRILPADWDWKKGDPQVLSSAWDTMIAGLGPRTRVLHFAQNDGTKKGAGTHAPTGKHCLCADPNGVVNQVEVALKVIKASGKITSLRPDCCMGTNAEILGPDNLRNFLALMIQTENALNAAA